ncbi:MAG: phytanoyl-CoA dioxygenase family protein [Alphaproteobacteria bacterium]|jgi:chlorinating enzyme|nr:phytanoyl-CoA dioxygenase family protein [Alphaproteobacteria bacterium]|tara:strand:- start:104 stop:958 length:855 start_codon:yes stop_codon:yes gene_type:complete
MNASNASNSALAHRLTDTEVNAFRRDGFVVPAYRLTDDLVTAMRAATVDLMAAYPKMPTEGLVSPHIRYADTQRPDIHDRFLDFCQVPELLDVVEQLIGPDIITWGSRIFSKAARTGRATPWHQDGEYWPIRPLATVTAWIAIDNCTPENGCLKLVAGSHRDKRLLEHRSLAGQGAALDKEITPGAFNENDVVEVPLGPGQMVLFDVYTAHGATPNTSPERRAGFAIRYMPGTSLYDRSMKVGSGQDDVQTDLSQRALFLLRGEDKTGANDFEIGHDGMVVEVA